ncbi:hypothetical protein EVG20_g1726 [Dentipellis fragilis]|uniref:NAD(P)-binding protein n=1 Tax=Dentipellis fragilis TaxID=205917 RepID=A0A4Y9ZBC4_9AGAM|nr:hypothetical protein EVG20_g1726 [Dentipellis fragilis]
MPGQLVWLITGTSAGLGRLMTLEALKRGDKVIATARGRSVEKLNELKEKGADVFELEVTAPLETLHEVAKKAVAIHGRIDILVNNAGYLAGGALEETTPEETYDQFNTNIFGALNIARAFLPYMRSRKTGTVVWIGSIAGWEGIISAGLYCATKTAIRSLSMAMDNELQPCRGAAATLAAYDGKQPGDPVKGIKIMVDLIRGEGVAAGRTVPHTIQFGSDTLKTVRDFCGETVARIDEWEDVFASTDFPKGT